jgi:manganese/zinc/iron transport system substrate-binding protein
LPKTPALENCSDNKNGLFFGQRAGDFFPAAVFRDFNDPVDCEDGPGKRMLLTDQKMNFGPSKRPVHLSLVLGATVAALANHAGWATEPRAGMPRVVVTTTIVADLVRQVAGDEVETDCLMGPGVDPHSFKATPRDADRLARADLVVASGLHLEGKLAALLERLGRRKRVVSVAESIPKDRLIEVGKGLYDPHVWFDPTLWAVCVEAVVEPLGQIVPAGRPRFETAAAQYRERLEHLDDTLRARVATIPQQRRVLVTSHDAFRYFGRAYGLDVVGIQGMSTESEAGLNDINRLVDLVVSRGVPAVFVETSVADRNVTALREGARAKGHGVRLGGRLYSDALGGPQSGAETLEEALRANVDVVVAGLAGVAERESDGDEGSGR